MVKAGYIGVLAENDLFLLVMIPYKYITFAMYF